MKVLVLGATGYIGAVVSERLREAGDTVVALTRPGREPAGVDEVRHGHLKDPASLSAAVTSDIDVVIHVAAPSAHPAVDEAAVEALIAPIRGTGKTLLYTSGVWVLGHTGDRIADEHSVTRPIALVRHRPSTEQQVTGAAADRVRGIVIRPGVVHGRGGGIPALLVADARKHGAGRHVGPGAGHWPMVHVDDLADLYAAAVRAPAGAVLHAVAEEGVPVTGLAVAAAQAAGVAAVAREWPLAQARATLGADFADALALDQTVSATWTQRTLGWHPSRPKALHDIAYGSYSSVVRGVSSA